MVVNNVSVGVPWSSVYVCIFTLLALRRISELLGVVASTCTPATSRPLSRSVMVVFISSALTSISPCRFLTAIPKGEYLITVTYSPTFRKNLPLVNAVKGFTGVRLHSFNTAEQSLGCIGFGKNDKIGWISNSRYWCKLIQDKIEFALKRGEVVKLVIE